MIISEAKHSHNLLMQNCDLMVHVAHHLGQIKKASVCLVRLKIGLLCCMYNIIIIVTANCQDLSQALIRKF